MARKLRSFYEPLTATRSSLWSLGFAAGEPKVTDPADYEQVERAEKWHADKAKAEKDAPWIVWGSNISHPAICASLDGVATVTDDKGIIAIQKTAVWPDKTLTHELMANRFAECVTACAGIADPTTFIKDVRSLMLGYCQGEASDPRDDPKVLSILSRCIPPEEMEQFDGENL